MGASESKPKPSQTRKKGDKYQVRETDISERLAMLTQLLEAFKTNNDKALDVFLQSESVGQLRKRDKDELRKVITMINTKLGNADKSSIDRFLQTFKHEQVENAMSNLLDDPYFRQAPADRAMVEKALRSVENIAARENFYMYQYIQLNAYLPLIFSALVDINTSLYKDVTSVTVQYSNETQRLFKLVEKVIIELQNKGTKDVDPQIDMMRKSIADSMLTLQASLRDQLDAAKTKSDAKVQALVQNSADKFKSQSIKRD